MGPWDAPNGRTVSGLRTATADVEVEGVVSAVAGGVVVATAFVVLGALTAGSD